MFTVLVDLRVKGPHLTEFLEAIGKNAALSLRDEPGCLAFDVHQSNVAPLHFLLYEVYRDEHAFTVEHRAAPHYAVWQQAAERCLEPGGRNNHYYTPVSLGRPDLPVGGEFDPREMVKR